MSDQKPSRGLKPLKPWVAALVPPVLLIVAWNTYARDWIFARFLPRKTYAKFVFVPREQGKKPADDTLKIAG